jgi:hypothetical protein
MIIGEIQTVQTTVLKHAYCLHGYAVHVLEFLQMGLDVARRVRVEYVADEPVNLREVHIVCRKQTR